MYSKQQVGGITLLEKLDCTSVWYKDSEDNIFYIYLQLELVLFQVIYFNCNLIKVLVISSSFPINTKFISVLDITHEVVSNTGSINNNPSFKTSFLLRKYSKFMKDPSSIKGQEAVNSPGGCSVPYSRQTILISKQTMMHSSHKRQTLKKQS